MNDPIAWRRAELERKRNHALARARRRANVGLEIDQDTLLAIDRCMRELSVLELIELSSVGENEPW